MKTVFTISNTTKSSLSDSTNQKKEKSISDLLVIVRPERVAFGLSLASSSSESQINARMTSLESSPPESMASLSYLSFSLSSVSLLSEIALLSACVNVLAFLRVSWPAMRGLVCCKQCLTITLTFSLLLLFKCCFSPWWFKHFGKFGIVYLKIYEILQNLSLRKKFIQFCSKYLKFKIDMLT